MEPFLVWYVDGILCIWTGSDRLSESFLNYLNPKDACIQLTLEKEVESILNFLDLKLIENKRKLEFEIWVASTRIRNETFLLVI